MCAVDGVMVPGPSGRDGGASLLPPDQPLLCLESGEVQLVGIVRDSFQSVTDFAPFVLDEFDVHPHGIRLSLLCGHRHKVSLSM